MSTLFRCPNCPKELIDPWRFAEVDLYCPLCGTQTIELRLNKGAVRRESERPETWAYWDPGASYIEIALEVEASQGNSKRTAPKTIPFGDYIEWDRAAGALREPDGRIIPLAVQWNQALARLALVPEKPLVGIRFPADGLSGELLLPGIRPEKHSLRIWPRPAEPLRVEPASDSELPELTAYLDQQTREAFIVLRLAAASIPVAVDDIVLQPDTRDAIRENCKQIFASSDQPDRKPTLRPVLRPGDPVSFKFTLKECTGTLDRVPFDLLFRLRGFSEPVPYSAKLSLRTKPTIIVNAGANAREDMTVNLGGRPIVFDLYLTETSTGDSARARPEETVRIDPPEHGQWLQPMQRLPEALSDDPNRPTRLRMKIDTLRTSRASGELADRSHDVTVVIRDRGGFDLARQQLRVRFVRMPQMSGVLALDWGTTNNCAAIGEVGSVRSLALDPNRAEEFERFSSALFVKSVESELVPELAVGTEAHELIPVSPNPECVLRGLKRLFLTGHPIRLRDPEGRQRDYPVEVVAAEYLRRMIDALEQLLDREIGYFGLTYPTKWPAAVRDRLEATLETVRSAVADHRPDRRIDVLPPRLDEATAVAFSALRRLWSVEPDTPGWIDLEKGAVVVAYDFGGGTVDTVVLEVALTADEELQTRLIGVGGRPDFGGDDITRGIVRLLGDRIAKYLKSQVSTHEFRILFSAESDRDNLPLAWNNAARQNAERLWSFAETIKRDLCQTDREFQVHPVIAAFGEQGLNNLSAFPNSLAEKLVSLGILLQEVGEVAVDLRTDLLKILQFELLDLYEVALDAVSGVSIRDRLVESFEQLRAQLADAPDTFPRIVVLAGGGCRLPLIQELARSMLLRGETDILDFQEGFAKQRVAHGKAWELTFGYTGDDGVLKYTPPGDVSHRALTFIRQTVRGEKVEQVVPTGSTLHASEKWYPAQVPLNPRRDTPLILWVREWIEGKWQAVKVGEFSRDPGVPQAGEKLLAEHWPRDVSGTVAAGISLCSDGGEQRIRLRLQRPGSADWLGPYPLIAAGSWVDASRILQGFSND